MPVNDFEKQVQQKMDELQLRPSAEVWEEVEKRIRKEKKRRWFILWFFIFGVLLLGGTGWWLTAGNKDHVVDNNVTTQRTPNKTTDETAKTKKKATFEKINENNNKEKSEIVEDAVPTIRETTTKTAIIPDKSELVPVQIPKEIRSEKRIESPVTVSLKSKKVRKGQNLLPDVSKEDQVVVIKNNPDADSLTKTDKVIVADINTTIKDAVADSKSVAVKNDPVVTARDTIVALTVKDSSAVTQTEVISKSDTAKTKKNKWEIGINAMAGTSNKSDGISIFGMEKSLDAANINNSAGTGGQSVIAPPAEPGNGFSWRMGVYAKRKLTVRTALSIGLIFSSYSTTQFTGAFVDSSRVYNNNLYSSSVRDFYRSGTGSAYKNHYYYTEVPVSFHWQINKGVKFPLVFHNGLSAGFFTGSDALVYNPGSNVFYKDNKSFNKIQFAYQSGLYAKLFNRSKNPLTAGILFNYHLSKLQKVNINGGNHLSSFGIQVGWLLKK
jgi:hypothetical protein